MSILTIQSVLADPEPMKSYVEVTAHMLHVPFRNIWNEEEQVTTDWGRNTSSRYQGMEISVHKGTTETSHYYLYQETLSTECC